MGRDEACDPNKPFPFQAAFGQCSVTATEPKEDRGALQKLHDRTLKEPRITLPTNGKEPVIGRPWDLLSSSLSLSLKCDRALGPIGYL